MNLLLKDSAQLEDGDWSLEQRALLADKLAAARIEVFPTSRIVEQLGSLPAGSIVPVSCSPKRGVEATLDISRALAKMGLRPIPHIAARLVRDRAHLNSLLQDTVEQGIREIFVVGGDSKESAGNYHSAYTLLRDITEEGYEFERVGITAYPEGHPLIDDAVLMQALHDKQPFATYMITQMCFDVQTIMSWLAGVREDGIHLPIYIGLPGASSMQKLLRFALQIGVGESTRFLSKHTDLIGELVGFDYKPTHLIDGLVPYLTDPTTQIEGFHLFTFNQIEDTERWRQAMLAEMA